MTIQELYIFACKNDLLDKDIYQVINKFNDFSKPQSDQVATNEDSPFSYN